jgi:hypothetical protein
MRRGRKCRKCGSDNWYIRKDGLRRLCRTCKREHDRKYNEARCLVDGVDRRRKFFRERARNCPEVGILDRVRSRARVLGVPWTITRQHIRSVWPADDKCPIAGIPLVYGFTGKGVQPGSVSLVLKDPDLGYVPGNIAVISYQAKRTAAQRLASARRNMAADLRALADKLDAEAA